MSCRVPGFRRSMRIFPVAMSTRKIPAAIIQRTVMTSMGEATFTTTVVAKNDHPQKVAQSNSAPYAMIRSYFSPLDKALFPPTSRNDSIIPLLEILFKRKQAVAPECNSLFVLYVLDSDRRLYSCGPAATSALPASLLVYLSKFLMNLPARSFAFSSHSAASA